MSFRNSHFQPSLSVSTPFVSVAALHCIAPVSTPLIHHSHRHNLLHDILHPIHLHRACFLRVCLVGVEEFAENNCFRLDLPPVHHAARMDGDDVVVEKRLVTTVRAQARGVGDETTKYTR